MAYFDTIKQNLQPPDAVFEVSEASISDESMSDDVILEELNPASVKFAVAVKRRSQGPKIKTRDGTEVNTDKARWEPAQCMVDGTMVKGFKYVGNSGTVYFSTNVNNYFKSESTFTRVSGELLSISFVIVITICVAVAQTSNVSPREQTVHCPSSQADDSAVPETLSG
ncbi:hypothetical protein BDP55DRAFT_636648 [Colletotrichum godetiae]|uniref:Uncharacterized protein n=1 Tax=Colletotrichum godetiae TaxID=1209918 RepID=A0AAJ0EPK6_9PEZI|nr:uncharacterized protein BDP55DRAFT_636648 [Colletotrichum godetiae]KAK1659821.1 hypothetical protein BDP55DRAFT_636648 [Colletotrichum godetiae]